jgi:hypothetical protein
MGNKDCYSGGVGQENFGQAKHKWWIHLFSITSGKYLSCITRPHSTGFSTLSWDYWHGMSSLYHPSRRQEAASNLSLSCSEFGCGIHSFVTSFIYVKQRPRYSSGFFGHTQSSSACVLVSWCTGRGQCQGVEPQKSCR